MQDTPHINIHSMYILPKKENQKEKKNIHFFLFLFPLALSIDFPIFFILFIICLLLLLEVVLSGCHCACSERIVLRFAWSWRRFLLFSKGLNGRNTPVLLCGLIHLYLLLSALFATEWSVPPVHVNISVIAKGFVAKKTSFKKMGLMIFKSSIIKPGRSRRRSTEKREVSQTTSPVRSTVGPREEKVVARESSLHIW